MKNIYKYILSFVVAFVFGLLVFQPKVYAYELTDYDLNFINSAYNYFNLSVNEFPNIIYDTSSQSIHIFKSFDMSEIYSHYALIFTYNDYLYWPSSNIYKSNLSGFANNFSFTNESLLFNFDLIYNETIIYKNISFPFQPIEVVDTRDSYPSLNVISNNKNYFLLFDNNENFRKWKLYVTDKAINLTAPFYTIHHSQGDFNIYTQGGSSGNIDFYQTSSDSSSWVLVDSKPSFNIRGYYDYDFSDIDNDYRLVDSLLRYQVLVAQFDNSHNSLGNYINIYPLETGSTLKNRIYMNSSDFPTEDNGPTYPSIPNLDLSIYPEGYVNEVDTNKYPYVIIGFDTQVNSYRILYSTKPLAIARKDPNIPFSSNSYYVLTNFKENNVDRVDLVEVAYYENYGTQGEKKFTTNSSLNSYLTTGNSYYKFFWAVIDGVPQVSLKANYNVFSSMAQNGEIVLTNDGVFIPNSETGTLPTDPSEVSLINNLLNTLGTKLKQWFVPSENSWRVSYNLLISKFPFLDNFSILKNTLSSVSDTSDPTLYIDFSKSVNGEFVGYSGTINLLDLSWYKQEYRSQVKAFTSVIVTIFFLVSIVKALPNVLGGDSSLLGSISKNVKFSKVKGD